MHRKLNELVGGPLQDSTAANERQLEDLSTAVHAIQDTLSELQWVDELDEGVTEYLAALEDLPDPDR